MKSIINHEELLCLWKKKPVKLQNLTTEQLRLVLSFIKTRAKKGDMFWNGVYHTAYKEGIDFILRKREVLLKPNVLNAETLNADLESERFLGKLNEYFPKSEIAKQTSTNLREQKQVTNPTIESIPA